MNTLEKYRGLIPGHVNVTPETINAWLELAALSHDPAAWGAVYEHAMILWAAHGIESSPGAGAGGAADAGAAGPLVSQRDGDLSRTYAAPSSSSSSGGSADADDFSRTAHGRKYLALRNSRAATLPMFVSP
jgi:uncharacterized protein DUF4054